LLPVPPRKRGANPRCASGALGEGCRKIPQKRAEFRY
jgi:hypothetical protein